jgi:hypothetical protein
METGVEIVPKRKITRRSAKGKGRGFQKDVARQIREYNDLSDSDVRSTAASVPGEDILFSELGRNTFPFSVECKNQEHLNIWQAIEQANRNAGNHTPIVVFKKNHSETYVTINFDDFLAIIKHGVGYLRVNNVK